MKLCKLAALLVIAALMTSIFLVVNASANDDTSIPSSPEFTVKIVSYPYDVPDKTTTTIDQYTGKETTTTQPGYHVENKSIEIKMKNQPLSMQNGFYFYIQMKGHYGTEWRSIDPDSYYTHTAFSKIYPSKGEQYTIASCSGEYSSDSLLDFQVNAILGHDAYESVAGHPLAIYSVFMIDASSGWSNIHTLNIGANTETITPNTSTPPTLVTPAPTSTSTTNTTPANPNQQILQSSNLFSFENAAVIAIVLSCIIVGVLLVVMAFSRKRRS
jgi:hypothetical protein